MPEVAGCEPRDLRQQDAVHPPEYLKPFDYDRLLGVLDNEPALIAKFLNVFIGETRMDIEDLTLAFDSNHAVRVAVVAHRVKGGAAAIGAAPLKEEATRLEELGRAGALAEAREPFARLQLEFERLLHYCAEMNMLNGSPLHPGIE